MPWVAAFNDHALRCMVDQNHKTYQAKHGKLRNLYGAKGEEVEVNIMTGKETASPATMDASTALEKVQRASALGLFPPKETSLPQLQLLAQVALAYQLDPLMGEIMPYQGRPYITIAGRRRLDAVAGHHPSIAFRLLNAEETDYYTRLGTLNPGDVAGFCVLTTEHGATVEGFGRVLAKQRDTNQRGAEFLPTIHYAIEMAQKRQERRAREMAYGPVPRPAGLGSLLVLEEGDETNIVEGTGRLLSSDSTATEPVTHMPTEPDYGFCPVHTTERWRSGEYGPYHRDGDKWCRFGQIMGAVFKAAILERHGTYDQKQWNEWLKELYGNTWSKLTPDQMIAAIGIQTAPVVQDVEAPPAQAEDLPA